jgi:hypothetical protein
VYFIIYQDNTPIRFPISSISEKKNFTPLGILTPKSRLIEKKAYEKDFYGNGPGHGMDARIG